VVSFAPRPLYPLGNSHLSSLLSRVDGNQSRSGRGGEEKKSLPLLRMELWSSSLVTIVTELPRHIKREIILHTETRLRYCFIRVS
jgi:hypothetical protein